MTLVRSSVLLLALTNTAMYQRIVLWQNGTVTDLQTVVPAGFPDLTDIGNVNLSGQIVVDTGHIFDGSFAPYVLIPKDH
jgi:hypothetical protein